MNLKEKLTSEILEAIWDSIVPHFARGNTYLLDQDLIIEDVAVAMAEDNTSLIKKWLDHGLMSPPTADQALTFAENSDIRFNMLIIEPYVLIQQKIL